MKTLRSLHPAWIATIIAIAVLIWLASGLFKSGPEPAGSDAPAAAKTASDAAELVKVKVTASQGEMISREAVISGRTAPMRSVRVKAQTTGRVAAVVAERGAFVKEGAVIARLAPDDRPAQLRQARAVLEQRKLQYEAAQRLRKQDYMTEVDLAQSKANLEIAQADVERIQQDISHTVIRAPFAGILEQRPVEVGDFVSVGDEIGYVLQQNPFIVRGSVSEDVVSYLEVGGAGSVTLIDGEAKQGALRYIAAEADEQTRTYAVELEVPNAEGRLIAGTSAEMRLPLEEVLAHELEPATLTLNEAGQFGIKTVDEQDRVHFYAADVVRNEDGKVWLAGLPQALRVITVGQGFVSEGDRVDVSTDAPAGMDNEEELVETQP